MFYLKNYIVGYGTSEYEFECGSKKVSSTLLALVLCAPLIAFAAENQTSSPVVYDIAINNGRVIDPET